MNLALPQAPKRRPATWQPRMPVRGDWDMSGRGDPFGRSRRAKSAVLSSGAQKSFRQACSATVIRRLQRGTVRDSSHRAMLNQRGSLLPNALSDERCRPEKTHCAARQLAAIPDAELVEQRRNVKFYGSDGDIEIRGDFFIRPVANHCMEDFPLARAQASGTSRRASFVEKPFRPRYQPVRQLLVGGHKYGKVAWLRPADQTLHGKHNRHLFDGAFQSRIGGSELRRAGNPVEENQRVEWGCVSFPFLQNGFQQRTRFFHSTFRPSPRCVAALRRYFVFLWVQCNFVRLNTVKKPSSAVRNGADELRRPSTQNYGKTGHPVLGRLHAKLCQICKSPSFSQLRCCPCRAAQWSAGRKFIDAGVSTTGASYHIDAPSCEPDLNLSTHHSNAHEKWVTQ